jgi:hypothetical protein
LLHAIQSPPTANFTPPYGFLGLHKFTATAENGQGAWFSYIISLFTFQSSIVLSLITIYLNINKSISLPQQQLEMH